MWNSSSSFIAQAYQPKPRIRSKVPEREAPSQTNPLSTLFYLAKLYTNVLRKQRRQESRVLDQVWKRQRESCLTTALTKLALGKYLRMNFD